MKTSEVDPCVNLRARLASKWASVPTAVFICLSASTPAGQAARSGATLDQAVCADVRMTSVYVDVGYGTAVMVDGGLPVTGAMTVHAAC